nr:reverse transcriptase domain-containing protein [Tanacetum cinerariifolium]
MLTFQKTSQVRSHHQNSGEAGVSKDISGDEGSRSEGTELIQIFIKAEAVTKEKLKESRTPLVGFSDEVSYLIRTINLSVTIGEPGKLQTIPMEFPVVKSHSPYNVILGRTCLRSLGAVVSTIHSMIKFPTANRIATMMIKRETLQEYRRMEEMQGPAMEGRTNPQMQASESEGTTSKGKEGSQGQTDKTRESGGIIQPPQVPSEEGTQANKKGKVEDELPEKSPESKPSKKVVIHDVQLDQTITIRGNLTAECRFGLIKILRKHTNAFAWTPAYMTKIARFIAEHELKTYHHIEPRVKSIEETNSATANINSSQEGGRTYGLPISGQRSSNAVLLVERDGRQTSIHYLSRTLQGAKINYPPIEKLALALVHAARQLRRTELITLNLICPLTHQLLWSSSGDSGPDLGPMDFSKVTTFEVLCRSLQIELTVKMDDPNITMEEYIRLEEEKAHRRGQVYNWETATYAIVYNDALMSKLDFSTELTLCPQHIDEFNLKDETSLSECDEKEQNILYLNDLFSFNVIYPDDLKSDKDNDDDKIDIKRPSRDMSVIPLPNFLHHCSANSWQWDLHSSGSGNTLHWQWKLILPVGTLS